jgi:hypothetical protein
VIEQEIVVPKTPIHAKIQALMCKEESINETLEGLRGKKTDNIDASDFVKHIRNLSEK